MLYTLCILTYTNTNTKNTNTTPVSVCDVTYVRTKKDENWTTVYGTYKKNDTRDSKKDGICHRLS